MERQTIETHSTETCGERTCLKRYSELRLAELVELFAPWATRESTASVVCTTASVVSTSLLDEVVPEIYSPILVPKKPKQHNRLSLKRNETKINLSECAKWFIDYIPLNLKRGHCS